VDAQLKHRAAAVAIVVCCALVSAPVRSETRAPYGGAVIGSLLGEPIYLDPVRARTHAEVSVVSLVFDTLYRYDVRGRVRPHLATAMPALSPDGLRARIPLLSGVEFHNGASLGTSDVVASLQRVRSDKSVGWLLAPVKSVTADGESIVITLHRKTPELAALLCAPATSVTPHGKRPKVGAPVGSGPFKLRGFTRKGRSIVLKAAPNHFAGRPYVNTLTLRWYTRGDDEARVYEAGRAHFSQRGAVAFAGHQPKYRTNSVKGPATLLIYLGFGRSHPRVTGSLGFRRALSLALSRSAFTMVTSGEFVKPAITPIPGRVPGAAARARPRQARIELRKAAARESAIGRLMGSSTALEILVDETRPDDREIAEKVVAALVRLNISAKITVLSALSMARRVRRGACDMYIGQLANVVADPAGTVAATFAEAGASWGKRQLQRRAVSASSARSAFLRQLPLIPLFHRGVKVHHRTNLRGIRFHRTSRPALADMFVYGRSRRSRRR
jgi:MarR-like DNA-binding transcriptional regulator SgrR of sgrS sRNA